MNFPVIVFDGGPFVCSSMDEVVYHFEPNDFHWGNEYGIIAFDCEGNRLSLDTEYVLLNLGDTKSVEVEQAVLRDKNPPLNEVAELRRLLIYYLASPRISGDESQEWIENASLEELIARASELFP